MYTYSRTMYTYSHCSETRPPPGPDTSRMAVVNQSEIPCAATETQSKEVLRMKIILRLVAVLFAGALCGLPAAAQTTSGTISGRVTDATGAIVPGASVQLVEQQTNVSQAATASADGSFVFPVVEPGTYSITVEANGFKKLVKRDLVLTASERLSAGTFALQVGSVSQSVTVTATTTPVQTTSSEISGDIDVHQIDNELAVGRDFMALLRTIPGVADVGEGSSSLGGSTTPYVNGIRNIYNSTDLDGMSASPRPGQGVDTSPNLDSIQEVKVQTSGYQAQYGQNSAGVAIQVVTKNGTNQFHGTAYYYNRNEDYNANSWFNNYNGTPRGRYRYNSVGGNIGGPVFWPHHFNAGRNKLFFFYSQEYWPTQSPVVSDWMIPTQAQVNGDFSQTPVQGVVNPSPTSNYINIKMPGAPTSACAASGTTGNRSGCFQYNGTYNVIPPGDINPNSQYFVKLLYKTATTATGWTPINNTSITKGNYNYIQQSTANTPVGQQIARIDFNPTDKLRMYGRLLLTQDNDDAYNSAANKLPWLMRVNYQTPRYNYAYDLTYTFSPTFLNEFIFGFSEFAENQIYEASQLALATKGSSGYNLGQIYPANNPLNLLPAVSFGGNNSTNNPSYAWDSRFPMYDRAEVWEANDNLTKIIGPHNLMFGFQFMTGNYLQAHSSSGTPSGSFSFNSDSNNPNDSTYAYANAVEGLFDTYTEPTRRDDYNPRFWDPEWFVQDQWRVNKKLTLDYGVRFAYSIPNSLEIGANFVPSLYNASQAPVLYTYAPGGATALDPTTGIATYPKSYVGLYVPGTGNTANGLISTLNHSGYPGSLVNGAGLQAGPRAGFAYDPRADGKTAIRGHIANFIYQPTVQGQSGDMTHNPPIEYQPEQFYGNSNSFTSAGGLIGPPSFGSAFELHPHEVDIYDWGLQIQQEMGFGTVFAIGYVGNVTRHMTGGINVNEVPYGAEFLPQYQYCTKSSGCTPGNGGYSPLPDNFFRPYPGYNSITYRTTSYNSNYNSMQVQIAHRYAKGLEFDLAYTWSKTMDSADEYDTNVATYQPLRFWQYGPALETPGQNLAINYLWAVPNIPQSRSNFVTKSILNGWQLSGIVTYLGHSPATVGASSQNLSYSTVDSVNTTGGGDGARILVTGNPNSGGPRHEPNAATPQYINSSVMARPSTGGYECTNASCTTGQQVYSNGYTSNEALLIYPPGVLNFDTAVFKNFTIHEHVTFQLRAETYNTFNSPEFDSINTAAKFSAFTGGQTIPTLNGPLMINGTSTQTNAQFGELNGTAGVNSSFGRVMQLAGRISF